MNCEFPFCDYKTTHRNKIHYHHIIPREHNGNNDKNNLICLCPNCHHKIFIEGSKKGIHNIKTDDSIIINKKYRSTGGWVLNYKKVKDGKSYFYFYDKKEEVEE